MIFLLHRPDHVRGRKGRWLFLGMISAPSYAEAFRKAKAIHPEARLTPKQ